MEQEKQLTSLPENAYRELKPGEEYTPIMPASSSPREVTPYSVTMGIVMAIVFSAAAAFLGLKVGQVFEAAIPIAIIAVGMGNVMGKRNMLGQNVIIQSIGASSGVIVAGAIFTLPALYILGLDAAFYQVFLSSLFGGLLGIVLLIPFRKYFVKEMHGKYPFPEATATTEVLISGEKGGNQAKLLAVAGLIGGLYDFAVGTFGMWTESVSTRICAWGQVAADKFKVVFSLNTSAAVLGLGYIIGLKYAMIITAGSCLVWFLVVPLVGSLADTIDPAAMASLLGVTRADILADPASIFTAENLFAFIGKPLGIGGIAMAGIIGIVKQSKIIRQAVGLAVSELGGGNKTAPAAVERTQRDLTMKRILTILIATLISVFIFFHFGLLDGWVQSVTAILVHHRPEDRLLARHDAPQAGGLEIPRHVRCCGDRGGRDDHPQQIVRVRGRRRPRGPAGQRHGRRDTAPDDGRADPVDALLLRRGTGAGADLDRCSGPRIRAGHVHPDGAERTAGRGRPGGMVRIEPFEGRGAQQGAFRPRNAHRLGLHRRRRADGCGERPLEIRRGGLVPERLGGLERRRVDGAGNVPRTDRLFRMAHAPGKKRGINHKQILSWI